MCPLAATIVWITFTPQVGHEQSGRRPALVLSPSSYNDKVGLAIPCSITSQVKGYPWELAIPTGTKLAGVVLADQAKSLDWRFRKAEFMCKLPRENNRRSFRKTRHVANRYELAANLGASNIG
jgi:mRNA interferase MazF